MEQKDETILFAGGASGIGLKAARQSLTLEAKMKDSEVHKSYTCKIQANSNSEKSY